LVGVLLVAVAALIPPLRSTTVERAGRPRIRGLEIGFVAVLTLAGGAIRLIGLDHAPPGGFFDEVQNALVAEGILAGNRPIFIAEATQMPALFFYFLAAAIAVAGKSVATVRGLAAVFGTLTLPAFYFLARRAFSRPVAVASAILLAGSRWHITFSRWGFVTSMGPLLEVLAVLLLWRAAERGRRLDYVLLGLVVGVGLQTYYSFNLFPAVLAVAAFAYAGREGLHRFSPELRRIAKGLVWSLLVAGVLLVPLARFAVRNPQVFFQRSSKVAIWNPEHHLPWPGALWRNIVAHLLMFNFRGDDNPRHNIPEAPLLNPVEGVLLALGLGLSIARATKWPQSTWLAWFVVMLLPAILTIEAPQAHRAVGAIPAVYLLIGESLQGILTLAAEGAKRWRAALVAALLAAGSLAAASQDVWRYFRVQMKHPLVWPAFQTEYHAIARFIKPFANRAQIRISYLYYAYPIIRFHLGDRFPSEPFRLTDELPLSVAKQDRTKEGTLYVMEPFQKELFPLFQALYPHARLEEHQDQFGRLMFVSIFVPRSELEHPSDPQAAQRGLLGAYYSNEDWQGVPEIVRRDPTVLFHFHWEQEALPGSFTADWTAKLRIEQPGSYTFQLATSGPTVLLVDDQTVIATSEFEQVFPRSSAITLSEGEHRLVIRYLKKGYASTIQLLWQPPSGERSVIPLRLVRPLSREEYIRLRDRLPLPQAR
jgi:4-amino-4-deoxy-L-arabinose transferase-like glycosyltransferase